MTERSVVNEPMGTSRLEAFSDGVMAVIITIMAFDLRAPAGPSFKDLAARLPALLVYILSFTSIGIYWVNHHHLLRATARISGGVMWSNLLLLFCLSLLPVTTAWTAADYRHEWPAVTYGAVAFAAAVSYGLLVRMIIHADARNVAVAAAIGTDRKGNLSLALYAVGIGLAFVAWFAAYATYAVVAAVWFIPDRRFSKDQPA